MLKILNIVFYYTLWYNMRILFISKVIIIQGGTTHMLTEKILEEATRISEKRKEASKPNEQEALLKILELFDFLDVRAVRIIEDIYGTLQCQISCARTELPNYFYDFKALAVPPEIENAVEKINQLYKYNFLKTKSYILSNAIELANLGFYVSTDSGSIIITLRV